MSLPENWLDELAVLHLQFGCNFFGYFFLCKENNPCNVSFFNGIFFGDGDHLKKSIPRFFYYFYVR